MRARTIIVFALIICSGSAWAFWLRRRQKQNLPSDLGLAVPEEALDFGEVWEQAGFLWRIPITNTSGEDIQLSDIESSCRCVWLEPRSLRIGAGQTREVQVVLDLTGSRSERRTRGARPFSVRLHPVVRSRLPRDAVWQLHGRVRNIFLELPTSLDFKAPHGNESARITERFHVTSQFPLKDLRAACAPSAAECRVGRVEGDDRRFAVEIELSDALGLGRHEFSVELVAVTSAGEALPPVPVQVVATLTHDVAADPPSLLLGAVGVGEAVRGSVRLRSHRGRQYRVDAVDCGSPTMAVEQEVTARKGGSEFIIRLLQVERGNHRTWVRFRVRQDGDAYDVDVPVLYYGITREPAGSSRSACKGG